MFGFSKYEQLLAYAAKAEAIAEELHRAVPYVKAFVQAVVPEFQKLVAGLQQEFQAVGKKPSASPLPDNPNP